MATIIFYDINETVLVDWARENCAGFTGWLVYSNQDIEWDDDLEWSVRYEFEFDNDHDAMIFRLRWDGQ